MRRQFWNAGLVVGLGIVLGACSTVSNLPLVGGTRERAVKPAEAKETLIEPADKAGDSVLSEQVETPIAAPPLFLASDLLGLSSQQLDRLLGKAAFTNKPGREGQLRRYDQPNCNLVVIMERDVSGRLLSSQLRPSKKRSSQSTPDLQSCLNGF